MTTIRVPLFLLVTFIEIFICRRTPFFLLRVFKIITNARRYMCSLNVYMYITLLQHNIISNFFVMKYNLPTNWLIWFSLETLWILFYDDSSTNICTIPLSFCLFYLRIHLHCLTNVRCMVNFHLMHG